MDTLCKLTLIYPPTVSDGIVELILDMKPPIGGFTTLDAQGHGVSFASASVGERVRGSVDRQMLVAIVSRAEVQTSFGTDPLNASGAAHSLLGGAGS